MAPNTIAIGGGDVGAGSTARLDRVLLDLTGKVDPVVLFIPTATDDHEPYVTSVRQGYGPLGASVEVLRLVSDPADVGRAAEKIDRADAIYVGGGNTKRMLKVWHETGVDELLRQFVADGKPVGGVSAGAICWFRVANSDWPQYEGVPGVNTAPVEGLNIVDLAVCPHTRDEGFRLAEFTEMMRTIPGVGIGIDDECALQIRGDTYRIIVSNPDSRAHRIEWVGDSATHRVLEPHDDFRPVDLLRSG